MQKSRTLPPVYFLGALVLAVALHYALPPAQVVPRPWHLVGVLLIAIGLVFIVVPARTFKARDTALKPSDVSTVLVQDGFFSISVISAACCGRGSTLSVTSAPSHPFERAARSLRARFRSRREA
jgi:hypothetical protein